MEQFNFSDNEIRAELAKLGYIDVSRDRLAHFKMDLERLISHERSKETSQNTSLATPSDLDPEYSLKTRRAIETDHHVTTNDVPPVTTKLSESPLSLNNQTTIPHDELLRCRRFDMPHPSDTMDQSDTTTTLNDTTSDVGSYRRYIRRKTSRKMQDGSRVIDESVSESEPGDLENIADRLRDIGLRLDGPLTGRYPRPRSAIDPPYRLEPGDTRPPSVIHVSRDHPHTRNIRKSDPVAKFHQMRDDWRQFHFPGEDDHREVRWQVRDFMVQKDALPKKPQRTFVANKYIVPTEKKREALRWQIRMDMARGTMPGGVTLTDNSC